jgi:putative transcriptional regulator
MKVICHLDSIMNNLNMENKTLSELTGIRPNTLGEMRKNVNKTFSREQILSIMKALELTELEQLISVRLE